MNSIPSFDPSKMDPQVLMQISQIVRELPPHQLQKMQMLMHNMMAGFDVSQEMAEFEKSLPAGFREKLMSIMPMPGFTAPRAQVEAAVLADVVPSEMNEKEARLTVLRAVAAGAMTPEDAERLLFAAPTT